MKYIKGSKWKVIEEIALKYKMLENPMHIQSKIFEVKSKLLNEYGADWFGTIDELRVNDNIRIIYEEGEYLDDYNLLITKITDSYFYGTGGLIKYRKDKIKGVIIWKF